MAIDAAALRVVVSADTSRAQSELKSFSSGMKNAASQFGAVGAVMSAAIVTPLIGIGVGAVKTAATFERSMNVLGQVSDATAEQMQAMSDQALQLGADTVFSANEAAAGMVELAKAGMDTEDVMSAIPGVMDLAAAGAISVEEAAGLAAATINTFGLEASKTTEVADMLAAAANASSADVRDLAFGVQNAGSVFAASGQNVETLATMMALLANNGLNASDAATSLKTMTMRLTAPTAQAAKVMKSLGIAVFNADGSMRDYRDIVADMEAATMGLSDAQRSAAFNTVFGADAIRSALILAEEGVAGYDAMATAVSEQGAAAEMAAAQNSGLSGAMEQISGSLETLFTKLALPFMDDIAAGIDKVTEMVNKIGELPEPVQKAALGFLGFAIAVGLATAAAAAAPAVIGALTSPIGLVALATLGVGLAAAIAWAAWETNWNDIQGKTEDVINVITPLIDGLMANLTTMWDTLGKVAMGEETEAPTFDFDFGGIAEQLTQMVEDITDAVNKLDLTTIDWWAMLDRLIIKPISAAVAVISFSAETFGNLITAVTDAITAISWGDLGGAFAGLTSAVITQLGIVVNDIISDLTPLFFLMSLSIGEQVRALREQFFPTKTTVAAADSIEIPAPKIKVAPAASVTIPAPVITVAKPKPIPPIAMPDFSDTVNNWITGIQEATDELSRHDWGAEGKKAGTALRNAIVVALGGAVLLETELTKWANDVGIAISDALVGMVIDLTVWSTNTGTAISDALVGMVIDLTTWADGVGVKIMAELTAIDWSGLPGTLAGFQTAIYETLTEIAAGFGEDLFGGKRKAAYTQGLNMGSPDPIDGIGSAFDSLITKITTFDTDVSAAVANIGSTWLSSIQTAIMTADEQVSVAISGFVGRVGKWLTDAINSIFGAETAPALPGVMPGPGEGAPKMPTVPIGFMGKGTGLDAAVESPDWATIITPPDWTLILLPLDWAAYVLTLAWETFVTSLDWATYVLTLEWNAFVTSLDWASYVMALEWNSFVTDINWSRYIDDVSWGSYIPTLDWGRFIPAFGRGGGGDTDTVEEKPQLMSMSTNGRVVTSGGITININVASLNNDWDLETLATKVANKFRQKMG